MHTWKASNQPRVLSEKRTSTKLDQGIKQVSRTKPSLLVFSCLACILFCSSPVAASNFVVQLSKLSQPTSFSLGESEFEDLASNVSARGIGGIYVTTDTRFGLATGQKSEETGSETEENIIIPSLYFSQSMRIQLDEGIDLGIQLEQQFIGSSAGGFSSLFDAAKEIDITDKERKEYSTFVYGGKVYYSGYLTQTMFSSGSVGGRGWLHQGSTHLQGTLTINNGVGFAAPVRNTGIFLRPEVGFTMDLMWTPFAEKNKDATTGGEDGGSDDEDSNSGNGSGGSPTSAAPPPDVWATSFTYGMNVKFAVTYRHVFPDLLTLEGALSGFGSWVGDPLYLQEIMGLRRPELATPIDINEIALPGGSFNGKGWEGGFSFLINVKVDDALLANVYPMTKLGFTVGYNFLANNNDLRFEKQSIQHAFNLQIKFQLW